MCKPDFVAMPYHATVVSGSGPPLAMHPCIPPSPKLVVQNPVKKFKRHSHSRPANTRAQWKCLHVEQELLEHFMIWKAEFR